MLLCHTMIKSYKVLILYSLYKDHMLFICRFCFKWSKLDSMTTDYGFPHAVNYISTYRTYIYSHASPQIYTQGSTDFSAISTSTCGYFSSITRLISSSTIFSVWKCPQSKSAIPLLLASIQTSCLTSPVI